MNVSIFKTIQDGSNFIFEAGPGSGKTTTLIRTLHQILKAPDNIIDPTSQKIACITFTNVAANEIKNDWEEIWMPFMSQLFTVSYGNI